MKPFNLEEAKAGKKVCTNDGFPVRIIDYNFKGHGEHNLIGVVEIDDSTEVCHVFTENGINECREGNQLFMVVEKKTGWANVMKGKAGNIVVVGMIYPTEAEAESNIDVVKQTFSMFEYVATAKIEWEE